MPTLKRTVCIPAIFTKVGIKTAIGGNYKLRRTSIKAASNSLVGIVKHIQLNVASTTRDELGKTASYRTKCDTRAVIRRRTVRLCQHVGSK